MIRFSMYCTCGSASQASVGGRDAEKRAENLRRMWAEFHAGPGHAPCDAKTAGRVRRREQKKLAEELERS